VREARSCNHQSKQKGDRSVSVGIGPLCGTKYGAVSSLRSANEADVRANEDEAFRAIVGPRFWFEFQADRVKKDLPQIATRLHATGYGVLRTILVKIPPIATPEVFRGSLGPEFVAV
jgi:hypothetical protein